MVVIILSEQQQSRKGKEEYLKRGNHEKLFTNKENNLSSCFLVYTDLYRSPTTSHKERRHLAAIFY